MKPLHSSNAAHGQHRPIRTKRRHQGGLTLIELLVALLLSSFIAIAAISSLIVARRGFSTVDAASQLRDNGRFASELIQRIVSQAGFLDVDNAVNAKNNNIDVDGATAAPPFVIGFNNAVFNLSPSVAPLPTNTALNGNRTASTGGCSTSTDTACVNGSDILVLRYQTPPKNIGSTVGDGTTINCAGITQTAAGTSSSDLTVSVFHVQVNNGEPSLMCSYQAANGSWVTTPQALIPGVESFQVLYGVFDVEAGTASAADPDYDKPPNRYLRADQMVVSGNAAGTAQNWRRVRSIRIGMVLRGPANSAQDSGSGLIYFPLGSAMVPATATDDPGARFAPAADGRLRQTVTFTVALRNLQL
ncbi:MAG: prepilin-type cleavage/methylation domain-containing protein [Comamonadaceae bacterium]|nr:MAG: prepilin-type cleavage/methylation domain-containing protein [Comamonadaceae bacterium]